MAEATEYRSRYQDDWEVEDRGNQWDRGMTAKPEDFRLPGQLEFTYWGETAAKETMELANQFSKEWKQVKDQEGWTQVQTDYLKIKWAAEQVAEKTAYQVYNDASEQGREKLHQELEETGTELKDWATAVGKRKADWNIIPGFRNSQIDRFCLSIMTSDAIDWMKDHLGDAPLVEVGTGTGYLAHEMQTRGIEVNPTEPRTRDSGENYWFKGERPDWTEIEVCDGQEALQKYPDSDLLWSWPWPDPENHKVLKDFKGERVIHIGDPGITDATTFQLTLEREFEITGVYELPNYPQVRDQITVWQRRAEPLDIPPYEEKPEPDDWDIRDKGNVLNEKPEFRTEEERLQEELSDRTIPSSPFLTRGIGNSQDILKEIVAEFQRTNWEQREAGEGLQETEAQESFRRMNQSAQVVGLEYIEKAHATASDEARAELSERLSKSDMDFGDWLSRMEKRVVSGPLQSDIRNGHRATYGFSVITTEAIDWIREKIGDPPVVEVGAGTGYTAHEMNRLGMTVFPTEPKLTETGENQFFGKDKKVWSEIEECDGLEAVRRYQEADLLWARPPLQGDLAPVLEEFKGEHLIYIGDTDCTGTEAFRDVLREKFETVGIHPLPNFPDIHDQVWLLRRAH